MQYVSFRFYIKVKGLWLSTCFLLACAEQADETWLAQFAQEITTPWDFTAVHINKNSLAGVKKDIVRLFLPSPSHATHTYNMSSHTTRSTASRFG